MSNLISVPSASGDILIEVDHQGGDGRITRGGKDSSVAKATTTFEDGWARVRPVAIEIIQQLASLVDGTEEVKVTFGVKFSADAGVFIASAGTEANFGISITWKKPNQK